MKREIRVALGAWVGFGLLVVVPLALAGWPWLTGALLESERAIEFAGRARWLLPAVVLVLGPFMVTRPLFDALGASRQGLGLSALRSLGLIVPCTFAGGLIATALGASEMSGLFAGNALGAGVGSAVALWRALVLVGSGPPPADPLEARAAS